MCLKCLQVSILNNIFDMVFKWDLLLIIHLLSFTDGFSGKNGDNFIQKEKL